MNETQKACFASGFAMILTIYLSTHSHNCHIITVSIQSWKWGCRTQQSDLGTTPAYRCANSMHAQHVKNMDIINRSLAHLLGRDDGLEQPDGEDGAGRVGQSVVDHSALGRGV